MIDKKRLTILIRNKCRIYGYDRGVIPIESEQLYYNNRNKQYIYIYADGIHLFKLNTLFETRKELEDYRDICQIVRTDELKLPTYKEFANQEKQIRFKSNGQIYRCATDRKDILIIAMFGSSGKTIYKKPLTEENYIQACRTIKNIFLEK